MNWKNILHKGMSKKTREVFNQQVIEILSKENNLPAGIIYDRLSKRFRNQIIPRAIGGYLKRVPGVSYTDGKDATYTLNSFKKSIEKSSSFIQAVVDRILTDEWITTTELHQRSLDLTQTNKKTMGRPYKRTLGRNELVNRLIKRGIAETKKGERKNETLIRRKQ